ncbi:MAG: alanine racemase, partial [Gallicola sp.]|nr:alanine racemase [Gallicola sp.]
SKMEGIEIDGIFTHFTASEEVDKSQTNKQAEMFYDFVKRAEEKGINLGKKHMSNSAAVIDMPEYSEDMVRNGYSISGVHDDTVIIENLPIKPVVAFKSEISRVRTVPKGTGISYGSTYVTEEEDQVIATVPVGYADGYKRHLSNKGEVSINGQRAKIRGLICMDQMMVDVTGMECKPGDEVVLFGYEEGDPTIQELAKTAGTNYIDVYGNLSRRVPKVYFKDGEIVAVRDYLLD